MNVDNYSFHFANRLTKQIFSTSSSLICVFKVDWWTRHDGEIGCAGDCSRKRLKFLFKYLLTALEDQPSIWPSWILTFAEGCAALIATGLRVAWTNTWTIACLRQWRQVFFDQMQKVNTHYRSCLRNLEKQIQEVQARASNFAPEPEEAVFSNNQKHLESIWSAFTHVLVNWTTSLLTTSQIAAICCGVTTKSLENVK